MNKEQVVMTEQELYLLDQLELADMLEVDDLYAWEFVLNEDLLDQADAAAQAGQPFASEDNLLSIEVMDGRSKRRWRFSYNQVMEAVYLPAKDCWEIADGQQIHRLKCQSDISIGSADD
jgi:hypothetical protein